MTRLGGSLRYGLSTAGVLTLLLVGACGHSTATGTPHAAVTPTAPASATPSAAPSDTGLTMSEPDRFAPQVRTYAAKAGINPQLLMAILYNESYKPHNPEFERAWLRLDSNAALGVANMHKAAFDDTKRGRDFAGRDWEELPDDPALAIEAAAWYLHDLAAQLPAKWSAAYTKDELLALGYNAGAGNMRSYARGTKPADSVRSYLDKLHDNWESAADALR